ncbi:DUF3426 domain-containing protein [Pseudomonas stutzeri]|nr:DUF3426 domain-containing protein [Stutzerimonas stutzeri]
MTESFVTQCPHCQTRFRVTRAQLGMARGAVRCGACLQVFNAAEQLSGELPAESSAPAATATDRPAAERDRQSTAVGGAVAGALAAGGTAALQGAAAPSAPEPAPESPPREAAAELPSVAPLSAPPPAPGRPADDTLWIHDDLDLDALDLELDEELARLEQGGLELSDEFRDLQPTHAPFGPAPDAASDPHDESWVEALLTEPAAPPAQDAPSPSMPTRLIDEPPLELEAVDPDFPELDDDIAEAARHAPAELIAERDAPISVSAAAASLAAAGGAAAARRSEPRLRDEGLLSLNDEPLQLDWPPPKTSWARRLLWSLLILLALGGLAGQYVWYNFEQLARHEQLRPWFEKLCPLLGCQLPPRVDVGLVKSSNLTVRSHPTHPGALTVDAILYNRADFAQPFPLLELRFEDINGQPLASRRFKPSEYLAGELAGQTDMPPQTPIHIALEIVDPGTRAVNYRLAFHSPD